MGRAITGLLLAIIVLVAAALIVPNFVDWTKFRKPIEAEATRLTGRQVTITGDIKLGLLLRPHLELGGLTVADPGKPGAPMLTAKRFEATAAWWPLFSGRIEIAQLRLTEAIIRVRINTKGVPNWALPRVGRAPDASILAPRDFASARAMLISPRRLSFSDVIVERSTLLYTDERNGANDRLDKLSGRFSLKGPYGPWAGNAGFQIETVPVSLALTVGAAARGAASPVLLKIGVLDAGGALTIKGNANGLAQAIDQMSVAPATFAGTLEISASSSVPLAKGLAALAEFGSDPDSRAPSLVWSRIRSLPLSVNGTLNVDAENAKLAAQGTLGHTRASLAYTHARRAPHLDLALASDLVDLDEMIDLTRAGGQHLAPLGAVSGPVESLGVCRCTGSVNVRAKALKFANASLSDLVIAVKLSPDGAELTDGHIVMPGETRLAATGRMPHPGKAKNGVLFDGKIDFEAGNPRLFATWLGVPVDRMEPNALKTLALSGSFKLEDRAKANAANGAGGERYLTPHLDGAALTLDDQTFKLSAAYDERDPGYLLFALDGEKLDADAYGIGLFWPSRALSSHAWSQTLWGRASRTGEVNVSISLAHLRTAHKTLKGFEAELARSPDGPATAHLSVGDLSGYQILFEGERQKPLGSNPGDETAHLIVSGAGQPINLPFAGKPMAGSLKLNVSLAQTGGAANWNLDGAVGTIKLSGEGTGPASEKLIPDIERLALNAKFDRATAQLGGSLRELTASPAFDGNLTVDADDFPSFMRELGFSYEPRGKDLGALTLVAQFAASLDHVAVSSLSASVGEDSLTATADLNLASPRATLTADIKAAKISLDGYLAAPEKNTLWSSERLKLDLFRRFDGEIKFAADRFEVGPWDLRSLVSVIPVKDGTVSTRDARAMLFGGAAAFTGQARIDDDGVATNFDLNVANFDWTKAAAKLFPALGTDGKGNATAHVAGSARGRSLMSLVSSFAGRTEISGTGGALRGFNFTAWANGLNGARGPDALTKLAKDTLTTGATNVSSFRIGAAGSKGTLALTQGVLTLQGGGGELSGSVLLVPRTLSLRLALVPATEPGLPPAQIIVGGPIAKPSQKFDIQELSNSVSRP